MVVSVLVLLAFLTGFEFGRLYRRLTAYLSVIHRLVRERPETAKKAADHAPGVVVPPSRPSLEPVDLSEDTGGILPLSPRAVALQESRREREGR